MTATSASIATAPYQELAAVLRDDLIKPGDHGYDQARAVYAQAGALSQWTRDYWEALPPHSAGGAYINFMMSEGQERIRAAYRGNYDRLTRIKGRYDPDNTFHINQNIEPASGPNP